MTTEAATHLLLRGKVRQRIILRDSDLAINHPDIRVPRECRDWWWISYHLEGETSGAPRLWTVAPADIVAL